MKRVTLRMPDEMHAALAEVAEGNGRSLNQEALTLLDEAIDREATAQLRRKSKALERARELKRARLWQEEQGHPLTPAEMKALLEAVDSMTARLPDNRRLILAWDENSPVDDELRASLPSHVSSPEQARSWLHEQKTLIKNSLEETVWNAIMKRRQKQFAQEHPEWR